MRPGVRRRLPLLAAAFLALFLGIWAGWQRMGWGLPVIRPFLPALHGPLMVSGFLGTLIALERAVALRNRWSYLAPISGGLGTGLLLIGLIPSGQWFLLGASVGLTAVSIIIIRRHPATHTLVMATGAISWLTGNGLWVAGWPVHQVVGWWLAFPILTIAGERLELGRVLRLNNLSKRLFTAVLILYISGLVLTIFQAETGNRVTGLAILALALWLAHYDLARRTIRHQGVTRFIAFNLLLGYFWLGAGSLLGIRYGSLVAGLVYDAWLHMIFVGFVIGMIFAHAPVILPALTSIPVRFHTRLYGATLLLQLSLVLRVLGDLAGWVSVRRWGGMGNGLAIFLFFGLMIISMRAGKTAVSKPNFHTSSENNTSTRLTS
ncbi:MAG: hypothetical protein D6706_02430 [Chloroflexi bacterium]|nr:MAG: hypothetical protein D6706_02430 [Chloroflexota bacterium]